nr:MAG TPA: zinc-ribbon containing domain protein [Caudoviricetes sp.]
MTSDERRAVADRLRYSAEQSWDVGVFDQEVLSILGVGPGEEDSFSDTNDVRRLADLIDPTCEDMVTHHEDASAPGKKACDGYFRCNRCNFNVRVFESIGFGLMAMIEVRYCPNCGARVVRPNGD